MNTVPFSTPSGQQPSARASEKPPDLAQVLQQALGGIATLPRAAGPVAGPAGALRHGWRRRCARSTPAGPRPAGRRGAQGRGARRRCFPEADGILRCREPRLSSLRAERTAGRAAPAGRHASRLHPGPGGLCRRHRDERAGRTSRLPGGLPGAGEAGQPDGLLELVRACPPAAARQVSRPSSPP